MAKPSITLEELKTKYRHLTDCRFEWEKKREEIRRLETEAENPGFWQDGQRAKAISRKLAALKEESGRLVKLAKEIEEVEELTKIIGDDEELNKEFDKKIAGLKKAISKEEKQLFLSGKYDQGNAILRIFAGAGGQDSQDWATMLLRMYERYALRQGYKTEILEHSFGEPGGPLGRIGTKQVSLEMKGPYAYGLLKNETGVHRLVRLSPFSAKSLRHTSFALVEVLPEIPENETEIKIAVDELKTEVFRASGPGGQNVNRRETAVRITHLPTKITVSCQIERSQARNKEKAMKVLMAKLYQLHQEKRQKELKEIKGGFVSASWGNQIRSYVLHPYIMVKDLRTGKESVRVEEVLDGNLDEFVEAAKHK